MNIEQMFMEATRKKLRFKSSQGMLSVEALWDLPLQSKNKASLDEVAISINRELKSMEEESFVSTPRTGTSEQQLRLEIVKTIIDIRKAENAERLEAADKARQRQELLEILEEKKKEEVKGLSVKEIEAKLKAL